MTFLNFAQLLENIFRLNFSENFFLKIKPNFSLIEKYFFIDQLFLIVNKYKNLKNIFLKFTFFFKKK